MLNTYGNTGMYNGSTFGNSTTTYSGGQTYSYSKPEEASTIICYKQKPKDKNFLLDATFVKDSIRKKYKLDSQ